MTELENSTSSSEGSVEQTSDREKDIDRPNFAVSRIQEELILGLIRQAEALGSTSIDLCHKGLTSLPNDLLQLNNLEYLYLEGNELTNLPDNLFEMLPNLQWLDLRDNKLTSLPMRLTGQLPKLRNLLLEGNRLTSLPPELGLIKSLNGLNIRDNPLSFPPPDIIEMGTQEILRYLREVMGQKSAILKQSSLKLDSNLEDFNSEGSKSDDEDWQKYLELRRSRASTSGVSRMSNNSQQSDLQGPVPHTLSLHQPTSYSEIKAQHLDKLKKTGADGRMNLRSKSSSKSKKSVSQFPTPPSDTYIDYKMAEERKVAKEKEYKMKTEAILQRRRDEESLKGWRDSAKKKQQKKFMESLRNGGVDYEEPVKQAPYGIDEDKLKIMTKEEKIKEEIRATHEKMKRRPLTPGERLRLEEEKAVRIRELERRIKAHTLQMVERRKLPKNNPQEEMRLAKQELDVAEDLQKELSRNRYKIEYRFRAFTGDAL